MCRPVGVFWAEACPGGHIGPPLRGGGGVPNQREIGAKTDLANGVGRSPPSTGGAGVDRRRGVVTPPYGWLRRAAAIALGSGAQRSVCGADGRNRVESEAEIIPKVSINFGQSLSQPAADSSLCTREPLGRGCGLPRRFAPRNDSPKPLSFRGGPTGRRGNPSFLRWTGVQAAEVVGPYGRSTEVPATGRCGHRPLRNKTGACRDCQGSALSAERAAGQIRSLPDTLKVQHGVQGPEVSAKPRPCSRRGCVN